ncbi:MAG TPA: proton-conducting transporter membrane subunit, partial [Pirellulales bacterium]|nr:proton-conducting transporter membrane subunit [Pirellulales bacterium]
MSDLETLMVLVPGLPLAACLITAFLGAAVLKQRSHWPVIAGIVGSFVCSLFLLFDVLGMVHEQSGQSSVGVEHVITLWTWADIGNAYQAGGADGASRPFDIAVTLRADPLTAVMLSMVTFISSLVAIYSVGYMRGDRGYWRFFCYVALFVFSMTMLVSVSNFALLYVFWEAVGLCSYLLIGFWYEKPSAAAAGKKAFLVTRIGDFGFAIGLFLIWTTYGTLNFHDVAADGSVITSAQSSESASGRPQGPGLPGEVAIRGVLGQSRLELPDQAGYVGGAVGVAICLCLLAGACGKSA